MRLKGDPSTTRALNRRLVLDQLRRNGPMSRAAITSAVGLSPAAITFVTAELISEGFLLERAPRAGAAGRRPVPLDIDYASRISIGLKVSVGSVSGVATDLSTRVIAEAELPFPDHRPEALVSVSARVVQRLLDHTGVGKSRLIGLGLALSGQVDAEAGICRQVQRFAWRNVPIAAMLAEKLGVPVWIDNDANAYAVSQHLFGHGRGARSIAAIAIGRGVGAGLVVNGSIYRGASGAAGEFGHNFEERGRGCECGRNGCLETYCSDQGILQSWALRDPKAATKSPEQLVSAARSGNSIAREVLEDAGSRLGRHVAALVNVFDPEIIVFGGEGVRFGDFIFARIRKVLDEFCYPGSPRIAIDREGTSWPRGAAALAIQHFFNFEATGGYRPKAEVKEFHARVA